MNTELPPLNALRAFEVAARNGSIRQAADELNVTHGAVSRQIRVLEEHLSVAVFHKEGRGVKLTAAGSRLSEVASDVFARVGSVCAEQQWQNAEAPIVVGGSGSLLARWFIPRLNRL